MRKKYYLTLPIIALLFAACGGGNGAEEYPQDLAGKEALLRQKREALRALTQEIDRLEREIELLDPETEGREGRLVTVLPATRKTFRQYLEVQGSVEAENLVDVSPEVPGRILRLLVREGDAVRAGQLIAEIDTEQTRKQIAELETSLELVNTVFERQSRLWAQNIGSELQFLEAKNNKERLEKSLETMRVQLNRSKVYAPRSGVVERLVLQSGELAMAGAPIALILDVQQLKVVANVPENYLRAVRPGETVRILFPALASEQTAKVSLIGRTIDPANRTFAVEARLGNSGGMLKPNLLAIMFINEYTEPNALVVPLEVVQQEISGRSFVFVAEKNERGALARKVFVETGRGYEGEIIILKGLEGGEILIDEGARGLVDGERIKIVNGEKEAKHG
jgi:membrane fusion protein (multidrug efflux system)